MADAPLITDYTSLIAAATRWLRRDGAPDEVTEEIPALVRLAEAEMFPELRIWQMCQVAWALPELDGGYVQLPENYIQPRMIGIMNGPGANAQCLSPITVLNSSEWLAKVGRGGGYPEFGIVRSHRLYLSPAPSAGQYVELDYYAEPVHLGTYSDLGAQFVSNEVLFHYPQLYLYKVLSMAGEFAESERSDRYRAMYETALAKINVQSVAASVGAAPRMRMPR